jgi:hypothetical protein
VPWPPSAMAHGNGNGSRAARGARRTLGAFGGRPGRRLARGRPRHPLAVAPLPRDGLWMASSMGVRLPSATAHGYGYVNGSRATRGAGWGARVVGGRSGVGDRSTATAPGRLAGLVGLSARWVVGRDGDWLGVGRATPWPWRRCHETGSGWRVRWGYGCLLQRRTATATSTAAGRRVGRAGALGSSVVARAWVTARRRRHQGGSRGSSGSRRVGWSAGTETGSGSAAPPLGRGAVATRRASEGEIRMRGTAAFGNGARRRERHRATRGAGSRRSGRSVVARARVRTTARTATAPGRRVGGLESGSRRVGWSRRVRRSGSNGEVCGRATPWAVAPLPRDGRRMARFDDGGTAAFGNGARRRERHRATRGAGVLARGVVGRASVGGRLERRRRERRR